MDHGESAFAGIELSISDEKRHAVIRRQLIRIQDSHAFRNSSRAKEFLSYVIEHGLEGRTELLKERSIGVNLFHRAATYVTGDDAIVRVKAAEVRKRLAQYYAEEEISPEVRIEIPVGSYIPKFNWRNSPVALAPPAKTPVEATQQQSRRPWWRIAVTVAILALIGIALAGIKTRKSAQRESQLNEFWAPVFETGQPVLICLSSPVLYYPSQDLYRRASQAHPRLYDSTVRRAVNPLELAPDTPLQWKDIEPRADIFVNKAHVYTVAMLSAFLERIHKTSQVKVGSDYSYNDLQNSPAVLLGAFDNPWSVRMIAGLPFYFQDQDGTIVEKGGQSRVWATGPMGTKDFAIVARLLNSKTGQFQVILGGISIGGTEAAGKLVARQDVLHAALEWAPRGWQHKNLEFVIETDTIDGSDSSTRVVAVKTW